MQSREEKILKEYVREIISLGEIKDTSAPDIEVEELYVTAKWGKQIVSAAKELFGHIQGVIVQVIGLIEAFGTTLVNTAKAAIDGLASFFSKADYDAIITNQKTVLRKVRDNISKRKPEIEPVKAKDILKESSLPFTNMSILLEQDEAAILDEVKKAAEIDVENIVSIYKIAKTAGSTSDVLEKISSSLGIEIPESLDGLFNPEKVAAVEGKEVDAGTLEVADMALSTLIKQKLLPIFFKMVLKSSLANVSEETLGLPEELSDAIGIVLVGVYDKAETEIV